LVAILLDLGVIALPLLPLSLWVAEQLRMRPVDVEGGVAVGLAAAYFIGFWSYGRTLGMLTFRLVLRTRDGTPPGMLRAATRLALLALPFFVLPWYGAILGSAAIATTGLGDRAAGTILLADTEVPRVPRLWRAATTVIAALPILFVIGGVCVLLVGGFGDGYVTITVRNDTDAVLDLECDLARYGVRRCGTLAPREIRDLARITAPRAPQVALVKGYADGELTFCREVVGYEELKRYGRSSPLEIKAGDIRCR
jgi:hypothetical protein